MPRYLISFDDGSMDLILDEDLPAVDEAAHEVVQEAKDAGVWIFGGGVQRQQATILGTDGTVTEGPVPRDEARHAERSASATGFAGATPVTKASRWSSADMMIPLADVPATLRQ